VKILHQFPLKSAFAGSIFFSEQLKITFKDTTKQKLAVIDCQNLTNNGVQNKV